jgi:hypothetical protein
MKTLKFTIFCLLIMGVSFPVLSQDNQTNNDERGTARVAEELHDINVRTGAAALEVEIEMAVENSLRDLEESLERHRLEFEPTDLDFSDLEFDIEIPSIELDDLDIDIEPVDVDMGEMDMDLDIDFDESGWNWRN